MSPDVLLEGPRTSFRYVLRVNVTERVWHSPQWDIGANNVESLNCFSIWSTPLSATLEPRQKTTQIVHSIILHSDLPKMANLLYMSFTISIGNLCSPPKSYQILSVFVPLSNLDCDLCSLMWYYIKIQTSLIYHFLCGAPQVDWRLAKNHTCGRISSTR